MCIVGIELKFGGMLPSRATPGSAGYDLHATEDFFIPSGEVASVGTGVHLEIPPGYEGQVRPRSGLAWKHGVTVLNAPGTIDSDYRGEVRVLLVNHGYRAFAGKAGERVAQIVFAPVATVQFAEESLGETSRGAGGFGSTGSL